MFLGGARILSRRRPQVTDVGHSKHISPDTSAVPYSGLEFGNPISPWQIRAMTGVGAEKNR